MGKWSKYRGKIPTLSDNSSPWQEKVAAEKKTLAGMSMENLGTRYLQLRAAKSELEAGIATLNIQGEAVSQLLIEDLTTRGIERFSLSGGGTLSLSPEPYASVADPAKLSKWIRAHKMTSLLSLNWQTLNAICKERISNGEAPPAGVSIFLKEKLHRSGGAGKEANGDEE